MNHVAFKSKRFFSGAYCQSHVNHTSRRIEMSLCPPVDVGGRTLLGVSLLVVKTRKPVTQPRDPFQAALTSDACGGGSIRFPIPSAQKPWSRQFPSQHGNLDFVGAFKRRHLEYMNYRQLCVTGHFKTSQSGSNQNRPLRGALFISDSLREASLFAVLSSLRSACRTLTHLQERLPEGV